MYNIHNHYTNIYSLAKSIVKEPSLIYLFPFGSSDIDNIEILGSELNFKDEDIFSGDVDLKIGYHSRTGPILFCYDQEPIISTFVNPLFQHVVKTHLWGFNLSREHRFHQDAILLNTELDSDEKDHLLQKHEFKDCYYFHHAFAASDWFRGYQYLPDLAPVKKRSLTKKFITFNRITSGARIYRSLLLNEIIEHDLVDQGHISFSRRCPSGDADFDHQVRLYGTAINLPNDLIDRTIKNINNLSHPLRIDFTEATDIPNNSFHINAIPQNMESFVHVVTETCYWGRKKHLTEKIFKPIVMRQPFVLVGCAHNLEYLKSYGFKTFNRWWDESYDQIENDVDRIHAIGQLLADICNNDLATLTNILHDMEEVLDYNYNWFYNPEFLNNCWDELVANLTTALTSEPLLRTDPRTYWRLHGL